MPLLQVFVLVPGPVVAAINFRAGDFDEADAGLDEPAGPKALEPVESLVLV